jgi:hypothetical protein
LIWALSARSAPWRSIGFSKGRLRGTVNSGATECRSDFTIDSPEPDDDILKIVKLAKRGCFAERMVQTAVPLVSTYTINDREIQLALEDDE